MAMMRAKLKVVSVDVYAEQDTVKSEQLKFSAVSKNDGYPEDGSDKNNTFAKFAPSADLQMYINNPEMFGKFTLGQEFYVDFTAVEIPKTFGSAV